MTYTSKVQIECPLHGWFQQSPLQHLRSDYGCGICGSEVNFDFKKSKLYHTCLFQTLSATAMMLSLLTELAPKSEIIAPIIK